MSNVIDLTTKRSFVERQPCFAKFTENETEELAALFTEEHVSKGTLIVTQGAPVDKVYLIVSGTADVQLITIENRETKTTIVATLGPDEAIGLNETGFYSLSGIRAASVIATTDMTLLSLSVAAFHGFSLSNPHVHEVMQSYANQVLDIKF
ncbi:MAG: hypothetical protein A3J38_07030 [Gammaproteobacteria bacterium RIFCSPHIGHO2_12_FULL_45_9]|nr:MAG: hypothetical protein A3J38_07030 [Gammaproteobacteria bacterium RIFCSPHIGHO2_12_FULL_45_9]